MWLCRCIYTCKGNYNITGEMDNDAAKRLDGRNKRVIFKDCARFTKCISRINKIIMEYQKIATLLDTESNQPSKFRTRN